MVLYEKLDDTREPSPCGCMWMRRGNIVGFLFRMSYIDHFLLSKMLGHLNLGFIPTEHLWATYLIRVEVQHEDIIHYIEFVAYSMCSDNRVPELE